MMAKFDIIGDIHGHAEPLHELLDRLGYEQHNGGLAHKHHRQVLFLGDFIDRGPQQLAVLKTVKSMVDIGSARAIMGNHELNAIGWTHVNEQGQALRPHTEQNRLQHAAFLEAVGENSAQHQYWIDWFLTLPIYLQTPQLQLIHACWSPNDFAVVKPFLTTSGQIDPQHLQTLFAKENGVYAALETLLKGPEYTLPEPYYFIDRGGHKRFEARLKWWETQGTLAEVAFVPPKVAVQLPQIRVDDVLANYAAVDRPTFIGHYWFRGKPQPLTAQVACLDYSVANDGQLVAYRFDGEMELDESKFVAV